MWIKLRELPWSQNHFLLQQRHRPYPFTRYYLILQTNITFSLNRLLIPVLDDQIRKEAISQWSCWFCNASPLTPFPAEFYAAWECVPSNIPTTKSEVSMCLLFTRRFCYQEAHTRRYIRKIRDCFTIGSRCKCERRSGVTFSLLVCLINILHRFASIVRDLLSRAVLNFYDD